MSNFSKKENKNQATWEAQENFTRATNEEKTCVNRLTRKSPCIKRDGMRISGHEGEIELPKTFHIPLLIQTKDDKGIKGATDKQCKMVVHKVTVITKDDCKHTLMLRYKFLT